jgi:hypothetical protein
MQSRRMSLIEATINVVVGYVIALLTQIAAFPLFGLRVSLADNILLGLIFTGISLGRSFALRRLFEAIRMRSAAARRHSTSANPCTQG